jgi:hypothetical protein
MNNLILIIFEFFDSKEYIIFFAKIKIIKIIKDLMNNNIVYDRKKIMLLMFIFYSLDL